MSRIRQIGEWHYSVDEEGGPFDVWADRFDGVVQWFANPAIGSALSRAADHRDRQEAEEWSRQTTWGPFVSAGVAAQWLLDGNWRDA